MLFAAAPVNVSSGLAQFVNATFANPITLFGIGMSLLILFFWYFATEIERTKLRMNQKIPFPNLEK